MQRLDRLPDDQLVALVGEGRRDAWDVLIARHDRRVVLTLLAHGVRLDRARDLAQETWARLFAQQRAGRLDRIELPGLAIAQARFLALEDARRRELATTPLDEAPELATVPDQAPSAEQRMATREQLDRALEELERCPRKARDVFRLVYDSPEVPHAEAASRVGLSVQRVRQTLCEVRARLRAAMEDSDESSS